MNPNDQRFLEFKKNLRIIVQKSVQKFINFAMNI